MGGGVFIIDIAHIYLGHAGRLFFSFILMYRQQSKLLSCFFPPFLFHLLFIIPERRIMVMHIKQVVNRNPCWK